MRESERLLGKIAELIPPPQRRTDGVDTRAATGSEGALEFASTLGRAASQRPNPTKRRLLPLIGIGALLAAGIGVIAWPSRPHRTTTPVPVPPAPEQSATRPPATAARVVTLQVVSQPPDALVLSGSDVHARCDSVEKGISCVARLSSDTRPTRKDQDASPEETAIIE